MTKSPTSNSFIATKEAADITVDVCVLGAGAVAAAAVLSARQLGLRVIQLAPQALIVATPTFIPRTYAIAPTVQAGLAQLGVWDLIPLDQRQTCTQMQVFWQHNRETYAVPLLAQAAGVDELCSFVSEQSLQTALNTALTVTRGQQPTTLFYDAALPTAVPILTLNKVHKTNNTEHAELEDITITTAGQPTIHAQLCVIAEGASSRSAAQLDLAATVFDYAHHAVVAELQAQVSPEFITQAAQTAWQWLGDVEHGNDVLALLPIGVVQDSNIIRYGLVWSQATAQAAIYMADSAALLAAVQTRIARQAPELGALSLHSAVQQFPLFKSKAPRYIAPCVALVGDTAHKIHPLAGQGLNLGFEDIFALFEEVAQREPWRSVGDARVLARYQRQRLAQARVIDVIVHTIARRGTWLAPLKALAQLGLRAQADWRVFGDLARGTLIRRATQIQLANKLINHR